MGHHDDASIYADLLARLGDDGTKEVFRRWLIETSTPSWGHLSRRGRGLKLGSSVTS
jgi:hypothetical protein